MKVRFLAEAEAELDAAVAFYDGRAAGLGLDFAREVRTGLTRIQEHPKRGNAWTVVSGAIDWTDFPMALSTQCFQPRSLLLR